MVTVYHAVLNLYVARKWWAQDLSGTGGLQSQSRYAVLDVRTTGFGRDDRILEIGVVTVDQRGHELQRWRTLVCPAEKLQDYPQLRITKRQLQGAPTFTEVAPRLAQLLDGTVVVAHNAAFEKRYLVREFDRVGITIPALGHWDIDTHHLAEQCLDLPSYRLRNCLIAVGHTYSSAGDALSEAEATAQLFQSLLSLKTCRIGSYTPLRFNPREIGLTTTPRRHTSHHAAPKAPLKKESKQSVVKPAVASSGERTLAQWLAVTGHLGNYRSRLTQQQLAAIPKAVESAMSTCLPLSGQVCSEAAAEISAVVAKHPIYAALVDECLVRGRSFSLVGREYGVDGRELENAAEKVHRELAHAGSATELLRAAIPFRFGARTKVSNILALMPKLSAIPAGLRSSVLEILPHTFGEQADESAAWFLDGDWAVAGKPQREVKKPVQVAEISPDGARGLYVRDGVWHMLLTLSEGMLRSDIAALPRGAAELYQLGSGQSVDVGSGLGTHRVTSSFGLVTLTGIRAAASLLKLDVGDRMWVRLGPALHFSVASPQYAGLGGGVGVLNVIAMDDRVLGRVVDGAIVVDSADVMSVLTQAIGLPQEAPRRKVLQRLMHRGEGALAELVRQGF